MLHWSVNMAEMYQNYVHVNVLLYASWHDIHIWLISMSLIYQHKPLMTQMCVSSASDNNGY